MITISSNVLVDDNETAESRFTTITLEAADAQVLEQFRDEQETTYSLSFAGSGLRAAHGLLKAVEVRGLMNGAPRSTIDNYFDAVAKGQGELVTLSLDLYNPDEASSTETVTKTGILTNVVWSGGSGGFRAQRLDAVFMICDRLWIRSGGTVTSFTGAA